MVNALLALLVLLSGALAGEWRGEGEDADEKLVLGADGRGELGGMRLAWRDEDGKTLVLRFDGIPQDVRFAYRVDVDGGVLTLQDAEGEAATYRRVGGKPAPGKPATPERPAAGAGTGTGAETVTGTAYEASGWGIDLEPGWKAQAQGETTLLVPPEVVVGCEVYGVTCKPVEPTPDYFDAQVATVAPFLQRKGEPGELPGGGIALDYEGTNLDGKAARALILARTLEKNAVWIGALALKEPLARREAALRKMYASLRAPRPQPAGAAGAQPGWLVGLWSISEKPSTLTSRTRDTRLLADGTFTYHFITVTSASGGGGVFSSNEVSRAGRWSFANGVLSMEFDLARDRATWPPEADSPHAQKRWDIPVTQGVDPETGRPALFSNGAKIAVKQP